MKLSTLLLLASFLYGQSLDDRYHTTSEIYDLLDSLNQLEELSDWFHLDTIGFSSQEHIPILAVRISDNASIKEDEPRVLFIGQVHAEEILGVEISFFSSFDSSVNSVFANIAFSVFAA